MRGEQSLAYHFCGNAARDLVFEIDRGLVARFMSHGGKEEAWGLDRRLIVARLTTIIMVSLPDDYLTTIHTDSPPS